MATKRSLTTAEVTELAKVLRGSCKNVYHEAERMFQVKVGQDVWDQLRDQEKLFKCEDCDEWKSVADESDAEERCQDCDDEM